LNQLDKNTYDYLYHQVRFDVLHDFIPEIEYPKYKNEILGLCVVDMYVEMIENNRSIDDLKRNWKKYTTKDLTKNVFAKRRIEKSLKSFQNVDHDAL
jgi:Janus kinase 2